MNGQLYVISAPSGAGKTSLVSALVSASPEISVCISHTTRMKRPGELDGVNYHFVDQTEFDRMVEAGEFLEHAHVFDHSYGTSNAAVETLLKTGVDVVLEIDWQGAQQIREHRQDCLSIFILPPSHDELEQRLKRRGEDDDSIVERRMRDAVAEMSHYKDFDFIVVNDDFHTALVDIQSIVRAKRLRSDVQQLEIADLLKDLLEH